MSKVKEIKETAGDYMIFCPACEFGHIFSTVKLNSKGEKWTYNGNPEIPSFHPSLYVIYTDSKGNSCICHSFIIKGKIKFLEDSTHNLKGQTLDLEEF